MFSANLFLGLELTSSFEEAFDVADPQLIKAFVREDDEVYLRKVLYKGRHYLGKFVGVQTDLDALELLEDNIQSLLAKIFPPEILFNCQLYLFPIVEMENHVGR